MSLLEWFWISDQARGWIAVILIFPGTPLFVWGVTRLDRKLVQRKAAREAGEAARLKAAYEAGFAAARYVPDERVLADHKRSNGERD